MTATKEQALGWTLSIIDACKTEFDIDGCKVIAEYYLDRFKDLDGYQLLLDRTLEKLNLLR